MLHRLGLGRLARDVDARGEPEGGGADVARLPAGRDQFVAVGADRGVLVEAGGRILDDGVAVEGLEAGVVLVAPAADVERGAIGLGEGEGLAAERDGHDASPGGAVAGVPGVTPGKANSHAPAA